jgi:hypothetical protein
MRRLAFFSSASSLVETPGDFTSINLVLANPAVKSRLTHTEFFGGSRDGFASSNEPNSSQSKLSGEWSWHGEQPFIEGLIFTKIR